MTTHPATNHATDRYPINETTAPTLRVLWVDEDQDRWNLHTIAQHYGLTLHQCHSWQEAYDILSDGLSNFAAIILDGHCVINAGEEPNPDFLYQASRELQNLFAEHDDSVPWYVLSAETSPQFADALRRVAMGSRRQRTALWGPLSYNKDNPSDLQCLCDTISHVAAHREANLINFRYHEVFSVLRQYFDDESYHTMHAILLALHYPATNRHFDPLLYYTQLRRILESLFRAANRLHILPTSVLGSNNKVNLTNSSLYLAGRDVSLGKHTVRYGKIGDAFFTPIVAQTVKNILFMANKNSHTTELTDHEALTLQEYYNAIHSPNLFFGYALQLCDVITWFGRRVTTLNTPS